MEDRETPRIHKYGESETTGFIMMANVRHVTTGSGLFKKFQAAWILLDIVYITTHRDNAPLKMRLEVLISGITQDSRSLGY